MRRIQDRGRSLAVAAAFLAAGAAFPTHLPRCLAPFAVPPAEAAVRPFVFGGGGAIAHEKEDLDEMLDPYTIRKESAGWEAGAGMRFFSSFDGNGNSVKSDPRWEIRLRLGFGGGNLPGTTLSGRRSVYPYQFSYDFVSRESYSFDTWSLGGNFLVNVLPRAGLFVGPSLQSVRIDAKRDWTGPTDCPECGEAKDKLTERYGQIEVGGRWKPTDLPLSVEGYAIPERIRLSTTHILQSDNWTTANFPSFKRSYGARLVYEF